ncbi:hypothetical protein LTR02_011148 [Friedmanniomyces endolithicus]|nr:hypothetical protein LTR94_014594 [Friedmanniomyces endolithicus]KAK0784096.1 hypothetical protein LTR38_012798 [Friedmanniomyces endolithicus]KAK0803122.1 hypothetical protein LTR75_008066 [Friedmanniomyces endolithicus]KAK0809948.1 hypothetical protein LTR59_002350 [Friedmanniomyces endolithicus]KAK0846325.1 hypothetical protein LTR03_006978 [Friedmanniomyces endolithicus]
MAASSYMACNRATTARLSILFLLLVGLFLFRDLWLPDSSSYEPRPPPLQAASPDTEYAGTLQVHNSTATKSAASFSQSCASVPGADKVLVLLKTGATELYQKLPIHVVTTFTCVPHYMVFSDLAQTFAGLPIHDAVAPVSSHFREHHGDFELYRKLQQYQREGQDMSNLKGDGGWNLDKWKFLPMLFQAFEQAEKLDGIEWFFVMEADTSVSWTNLLQWLETMDPKEPHYLGAQNVIGDTTFAHGGSGVVLSRRTADLMLQRRDSMGKAAYAEKWEEETSTSCCGDEIIARAFKDAGVELTPAWPLIQGETVNSIDWTENHWCTPAITWHHVSPLEVDLLFQFQSEWVETHGWSEPYLYHHVFDHFIARHVAVNRTEWNNISKDQKYISASLAQAEDRDFWALEEYEQASVESAEACAEACGRKGEWECLQWMFTPGRCYLGKDLRFGRSDEREGEHWVSGWVRERLERFEERFAGSGDFGRTPSAGGDYLVL